MKSAEEFCTCRDIKCPMHPVNHNKGCSPCILKNLKSGEIPSCFFNKIGSAADAPGYTYRDFAEMAMKSG